MQRFLFFLVLIASGMLSAQECTTYVPVSAFDAKTRATIRGLSASDFAVRAGNNLLHVSRATPMFHNRVLILVNAGAAGQQEQSPDELKSIAEMASNAPPEMPVAFGIYASHAIFTHGFLTRPADLAFELEDVMEKASALHGTSDTPAALHQALAMFGPHQTGDTILLVARGSQPLPTRRAKELAQDFWRRGVRLVIVAQNQQHAEAGAASIFNAFADITSIDSSLIALANRTGGALMGYMTSEWFNLASDGYILALASPASGDRQLKLSIALSSSDLKADLFFPQRITPCSGMLSATADTGRIRAR